MLTATQLIRQAALKTKSIDNGRKIIEYNDVEMIDVPDDTCWLCGGATNGRGGLKSKVIKSTFTDHDLAKNMQSGSICPGCVFCLSFLSLRNFSIVATEHELMHPDKNSVRALLLDPPEPPFVFAIAVSGQKWLHFKAPINYSRDRFIVLLEEMPISVISTDLAELLSPIEDLYQVFSKAEIASGQYNQSRIKKFGIAKWEELEQQISPKRGSRLFNLAIHVARKEDN